MAESNSKPASGQNLVFLSPGDIHRCKREDPNRPRQVMGFRDLVLFYVITGISLRWIATAAAAGPSSIVDLGRRMAVFLYAAGALGAGIFVALSE